MTPNDDIPASASARPPLPELHQSELDDATLQDYFRDLAACADVFEIIPKAGRDSHASQQQLTLDQAQSALRERTVRGVQLRYRYDNQEWWDTLLVSNTGVRIVRMAAPKL